MGHYDEYLEHHGILGQKWGVRRFQNKNGHLTTACKARYDGDKVTEKEKHVFSAKAAGYKALGAMHNLNAKTAPTKAGKEANKQAEKAQKEADAKKAAKGEKQGLTPDQKKKIAIAGAAVVGTALVTYGGIKLHQMNNSKIQSKTLPINTIKPPVKTTPIPRTEVKRTPVNTTPIPRTEVKRTPVNTTNTPNYNDSLQKTLNAMKSMNSSNAKVSKVSKQQTDYTQQLLKKHSKTLNNYTMSDLAKMDLY